jgi:hypothetical protein
MNKIKHKGQTRVHVGDSVSQYDDVGTSGSNVEKSETSKLKCFMGCSVTLFLLTLLFVLLNFGFIVSVWVRLGHLEHPDHYHHYQQHPTDDMAVQNGPEHS